MIDKEFQTRFWDDGPPRDDDERDQYQRDKARVIHSFAFRRLQTKTQVMGVGEGDFHRTRLTHSIEVAQIGDGLLNSIGKRFHKDLEISSWLPSRDLLAAACLAHDLGHPPFGHGGEKALHRRMIDHGGFEGNGHTLRIVTRLERYTSGRGMNPTRRFVLAVLKYPIPYSFFDKEFHKSKPPKCYFDSEKPIVDWALSDPISKGDADRFTRTRDSKGKPKCRTIDCSIMEAADDIAFAVHDLEDIVARRMVHKDDILDRLQQHVFVNSQSKIGSGNKFVSLVDFEEKLFEEDTDRKQLIGKLVNLFVTSSIVERQNKFDHPLLDLRVNFDESTRHLLETLKNLTYELVIEQAEIQQLERRGQRIIKKLFGELMSDPGKLIPRNSWNDTSGTNSTHRRVCDYIAGMTDSYAQKIYSRLFVPGKGSSRDEI